VGKRVSYAARGEVMKSMRVGEIEVVSLTDIEGAFFSLDQIFPGVAGEQWEPYRARYPWAFGDGLTLHGRVGSYLLRTPNGNLLVDTGVGPGAFGMRGRLLWELGEAGLSPEDIDTVFLTQLHGDHLGWALSQGGEPTFENARYLVQADEWEAFEPHVGRFLAPLEKSGALEFLYGEEFIGEELTAIPTPGHSPGHQSLLVTSGSEQLIVAGDVIVHPAQVSEPTWNMVFDGDKEAAAYTREMFLDWVEADGITVAAGHVPGSGFGRIARDGAGRYWSPADGSGAEMGEEIHGSRVG
jgi:glyoxylase-like metal-dependent hydrolase (beta-lactamase superfamily II)